MKTIKIILSVLFICSCLFNSCKNSGEEYKAQVDKAIDTLLIGSVSPCYSLDIKCPTCNSNATWTKYGDIGEYNIIKDRYLVGERGKPLHLGRDCGWKISDFGKASWGDSYEITSCNDGVVLNWTYGSFHAIWLEKNWKGYFNDPADGIKIGCSLEHFLEVYTKHDIIEGLPFTMVFLTHPNPSFDSESSVRAEFDNKKLVRLVIFLSAIPDYSDRNF